MTTRSGGKSRKATIYDIAVATSTSPSAVSMVLNGKWRNHRIREETAQRILEVANELGYAVNLRARALRLARSGLTGMIVPHYRNRFFASLSETFEVKARERGFCPIVVSTRREAATERQVVESLLAQQVEHLFITGVADPDPLNAMCRKAGIPCVNIDLPGHGAPSIVTDNRRGAHLLADAIVGHLRAAGRDEAIYFFGGRQGEYATEERLAGFRECLSKRGIDVPDDRVRRCDYWPEAARAEIERLYDELGRMPGAVFVNSSSAFEGIVRFLSTLPSGAYADVVIGCFDWEPVAAFLPITVALVRQDVKGLIDEAFARIEAPAEEPPPLVKVMPQLITKSMIGSTED
jgi:LacI family transcriptional regulator, fructose operon transcriptional repressor